VLPLFRMQWAAVSIQRSPMSSPVHVVDEPPSFLYLLFVWSVRVHIFSQHRMAADY